MTIPTDKALYTLIEDLLRYAQEATGDPKIMLTITAGGLSPAITLQVMDNLYNDDSRVRGKELSAILSEYARRKGFQRTQDALLLSAPVLDASAG